MKQNEEKIQAECVRIFRYMHQPLQWRFFSVPNGGKRDIVTAVKLKNTGAVSGVWDLFLSVPKGDHCGMFIEIKAGKNKLTENQIKFKEENCKDYAFEVCYSTSEFITAVNNYLNRAA